jgi:hypothetical protein
VSTFVKKNRFCRHSFVRSISRPLAVLVLLLVAGLLAGLCAGFGAPAGFMSGRGSLAAMYAVPGPELWVIRRAAHDVDPFRRAAACYALSESGGDYGAFFLQRLGQEREFFVKRALLWGLAFSRNAPDAIPEEVQLEQELREWYISLKQGPAEQADGRRFMDMRFLY